MKKLPHLTLLLLVIIVGCDPKPRDIEWKKIHDLAQIMDSGELVALTLYGSISFFNYQGREMGFEYELADQFAQSLGLRLKVKVAANTEQLIRMLKDGEGDIIAFPLPISTANKDSLLFCGEELVTHQVVVQRNIPKQTVDQVTELVGKEIYAKPGKYLDRLISLNEELGGGIRIKPVEGDSLSEEELITAVAKGEIGYTIIDHSIARLNKTYYPNLDIDLAVTYDQRSSWATRRDCPLLAAMANLWFATNQTSPSYKASLKRYFEISKAIPYSSILSIKDGKISAYDTYFRKYAKKIKWDWRLLAALAYTESNFDTTVVSWAGARGLMQLMPNTARAMGMPEGKEHNPEESIKAAVKYIDTTSKSFRDVTDSERANFVLAAYNTGVGHILDAMALARKHGANPYLWKNNVEKYILLKSNPEYYNDEVCKFGYLKGEAICDFVDGIMNRYEMYKSKIPK